MDRCYDLITFFFKIPLLYKLPRVTSFVDIIKIATMVIKTSSKDSKKVKRIRNYVLKLSLGKLQPSSPNL